MERLKAARDRGRLFLSKGGFHLRICDFKLERYFARYEFQVDCLLSASDCEALTLEELLALADRAGLELWQRLRLGYTESPGHSMLRAEISRIYHKIAPENVLVTAPEEGILLALSAILTTGDQAIVISPCYQSLSELPAALGAEVVNWPLRLESDWSLDLAELAAKITPRTKLLVVNFPHNPTGFLPTAADWYRLIELARRYNLYLFSDEMYWQLENESDNRLEPAADLYEKGITLSGLSKSYGLPGLRIGWLASRDEAVLRNCARLKDYTTICSSAPSEILAIIALRAKETIIERNRELIRNNTRLAAEFFKSYPSSFRWLPPQGGSVAFPELTASLAVEEFCRDVVERKSLMILPGTVYDAPGNHFRVGLGRRNLEQGFERLADYIQEFHPEFR